MDPQGLKEYPKRPLNVMADRINAAQPTTNQFDYLKENGFMNTDKITTIAGVTAVVCTGLLGAGVLVPATLAYSATIGIGTVSGIIFAWFTNKENPFKAPKDKK